MEESDVQ